MLRIPDTPAFCILRISAGLFEHGDDDDARGRIAASQHRQAVAELAAGHRVVRDNHVAVGAVQPGHQFGRIGGDACYPDADFARQRAQDAVDDDRMVVRDQDLDH